MPVAMGANSKANEGLEAGASAGLRVFPAAVTMAACAWGWDGLDRDWNCGWAGGSYVLTLATTLSSLKLLGSLPYSSLVLFYM